MRSMLIRTERIKLLEILQEVRTIYKTRNQLLPTGGYASYHRPHFVLSSAPLSTETHRQYGW